MPPARVIPDKTTLRHLVAAGHTHQDIADIVFETTGTPVTRGAVSSAISRAGLSKQGKRYQECLPWRVKIEHSKHYAARMLRLLGRTRNGEELHEHDAERLASWRARLALEDTVVAYIPETEEGFHYMRKPVGWEESDIPIIPTEIRLAQVGETIRWD